MEYRQWPAAGPYYGDTSRCPYCHEPISGPECSLCDVPLSGDDMQHALAAGVAADQWLAVREHHLLSHKSALELARSQSAIQELPIYGPPIAAPDTSQSGTSGEQPDQSSDPGVESAGPRDMSTPLVAPGHSRSTNLDQSAPNGQPTPGEVPGQLAGVDANTPTMVNSAAFPATTAGTGTVNNATARKNPVGKNPVDGGTAGGGLDQTSVLAGAGALLLALSVIVFVATYWASFGFVGRFSSLLGIAALFGTITTMCSRKKLRTTAEASAVVSAISAFTAAFAFDGSDELLPTGWVCLVTTAILGINTYTDVGRRMRSLTALGALAVVPSSLALTEQVTDLAILNSVPEGLKDTLNCVVWAVSLWVVARILRSNHRFHKIERWGTPLTWTTALLAQLLILMGKPDVVAGVAAFSLVGIGVLIVHNRKDFLKGTRHFVANATTVAAFYMALSLSKQTTLDWDAIVIATAMAIGVVGIWRQQRDLGQSQFWHVPAMFGLTLPALGYIPSWVLSCGELVEVALIRDLLPNKPPKLDWPETLALVTISCATIAYFGSRTRHLAVTIACLAIAGLWPVNLATAMWLIGVSAAVVAVAIWLRLNTQGDLRWAGIVGTLGVCLTWSYGPWIGGASSVAALILLMFTAKPPVWQSVGVFLAGLTSAAFCGFGQGYNVTLTYLVAGALGSCLYAAVWSWRNRNRSLAPGPVQATAVAIVLLLVGPQTLLYSLRLTGPSSGPLVSGLPVSGATGGDIGSMVNASVVSYLVYILTGAVALWVLWHGHKGGRGQEPAGRAPVESWCHRGVVTKLATAVAGTAVIAVALRIYSETLAPVMDLTVDIPALMHAAAPLVLIGIASRWRVVEYRTCFVHAVVAIVLAMLPGRDSLASLWIVFVILAAGSALNTSAHTWNKPPKKRLVSYWTTIGLLAASLVSHMAFQGLHVVEWYTWPLAVLVATAGCYWNYRYPDTQTRQLRNGSLWAGAGLATWPSALMSSGGDWRSWYIVGLAAVAGLWFVLHQYQQNSVSAGSNNNSTDSSRTAKQSDSAESVDSAGVADAAEVAMSAAVASAASAESNPEPSKTRWSQPLHTKVAVFALATLVIGPVWQTLVNHGSPANTTVLWWAAFGVMTLLMPSPWRSAAAVSYLAFGYIFHGYAAATSAVFGIPAVLVIHGTWAAIVASQVLVLRKSNKHPHSVLRFNLHVGVWLVLAWSQTSALGWKPESTTLWYAVLSCGLSVWWLTREQQMRSWYVMTLPLVGLLAPLVSALHRSPSGDAALYAMSAIVAAVAVTLLVGGWHLGWKAPAVAGMGLLGYLAAYIVANTEQQISTTLSTLVILGLALLWFGARREAHRNRIRPLHERFNQLR